MEEIDNASRISIARGNIYIPAELHEKYLGDAEAVAVIPDDHGILVIPLIQTSAGGMLLKLRNLRGDRVVHAQEFFRTRGYVENATERFFDVRWLAERAGLLVEEVPMNENADVN